MFLSALKAYWQGRKELFEGLEIAELEKDSEGAFEPYPVFYFDFNGQNYQAAALEDVLDKMLGRWEEQYDCKGQGTLSGRFQDLLLAAREKTGKKCVVLVDEYDAVACARKITDSLGCFKQWEVNRADYYTLNAPEGFRFSIINQCFDAESPLTESIQQLPQESKIYLDFDVPYFDKITYPEDLVKAEAIMRWQASHQD